MAQPEISDDAEPYFAAFAALQRDRPILAGMAVALPLPVPRTMIEQHARRIGIERHLVSEFVEIVAAIDDYFVERAGQRILADLKSGKAGKG